MTLEDHIPEHSRRYVSFNMMPASTLAKYVLKETAYVQGQHCDKELLRELRSMARGYETVFFEGFFIWYADENAEHEEYPAEYNILVTVDGIRIYNQLTRETLLSVINDFSHADEVTVTDSEEDNELNLRLWWD